MHVCGQVCVCVHACVQDRGRRGVGAQAGERKYDLFAVCGPRDRSQAKHWPALAHFYVFI